MKKHNKIKKATKLNLVAFLILFNMYLERLILWYFWIGLIFSQIGF